MRFRHSLVAAADDRMSRRAKPMRSRRVTVVAVLVVSTMPFAASNAHARQAVLDRGPVAPPSAPALAADSAAALVASRPAFLNVSDGDEFQPGKVTSSGGTQYVPYERTHAGLPVRGGDFVVVTNNAGQVLYNSVAL